MGHVINVSKVSFGVEVQAHELFDLLSLEGHVSIKMLRLLFEVIDSLLYLELNALVKDLPTLLLAQVSVARREHVAEFMSVRLHFDCPDQSLEACEVDLVLQCLNDALQV
jgi:hypothetical protein